MSKKRELPWGGIIYRKDGGGSWYWQYFDREKGRTVRVSTRANDRTDAQRIAHAWAVQYLAQRDGFLDRGSGCGVTLEFAYREYFKNSMARLSERYLYEIARYWDDYMAPFFGDVDLCQINAHRIAEYGTWLVERVSPQTANKALSTLSRTLRYAARAGWIDTIPYISRIPERKRQCGYELSDEEIAALWEAADESAEHVRRFLALCLYCGLRHSEAAEARWDDIDWRLGIIHVIGKNGWDMPAPIGKAREMLEAVPPSKRIGSIVLYEDIIRRGETRPIESMRRAWRTLKRRAGLPDAVRIHDLRHTFVSRMFRLLGYDARFLSRHRSQEAFTRYLHADREKLYARAAEAF